MLCYITICLFTEFAWCLRLKEIRIPNHTVRNTTARFECQYDLDGEALYSVKWYKDGNEFYRYVPRDEPPVQIFPLQGIRINVSVCCFSIYILFFFLLSSPFYYKLLLVGLVGFLVCLACYAMHNSRF